MKSPSKLIARKLILFVLLLFSFPVLASEQLLEDNQNAIVLSYLRIGEPGFPEENLPMEQFLNHMAELTSGEYKILPLPYVIKKIQSKENLPDNAVVITFEGLHRSTFSRAIPYLLQKNLPFTVFYAADELESNESAITSNELRDLAKNPLVSVGIKPANSKALSETNPEDLRRNINSALIKYREIFVQNPRFFIYPEGEYSQDYIELLKNFNFQAAFSRRAGTLYPGQDFLTLPRFVMTELFGNIERFRIISKALPLPVKNQEPAYPTNISRNALVGFTVDKRLINDLSSLSCFISGKYETKIEILGNRVELRPDTAFTDPKTQINCTLPVQQKNNDIGWRWFGMYLSHTNE